MTKAHLSSGSIAAGVLGTVLTLGGLPACSATLPPAPAHARVLPSKQGPPLEVCWLEYAHAEQRAGYAHAGGSAQPRWEVTASGLLIRHPSGHLLLDLGNSTRFDEEIAGAHFVARQYLKLGPGGVRTTKTALSAMAEVGESPSQLRAVAISHIHADHAGGLVDLPRIPVLAAAEEIAFASRMEDKGEFPVVREHAQQLLARMERVPFSNGPYETLDESTDYFEDGSVVFVALPGHTPGSMGTFVSVGPGLRLFHVGDATNSVEALDLRVGKSYALAWTDEDPKLADLTVARLSQLHALDPSIHVLPAHDRAAWAAVFPGGPGTCIGTRSAPPPASIAPIPR